MFDKKFNGGKCLFEVNIVNLAQLVLNPKIEWF